MLWKKNVFLNKAIDKVMYSNMLPLTEFMWNQHHCVVSNEVQISFYKVQWKNWSQIRSTINNTSIKIGQ